MIRREYTPPGTCAGFFDFISDPLGSIFGGGDGGGGTSQQVTQTQGTTVNVTSSPNINIANQIDLTPIGTAISATAQASRDVSAASIAAAREATVAQIASSREVAAAQIVGNIAEANVLTEGIKTLAATFAASAQRIVTAALIALGLYLVLRSA